MFRRNKKFKLGCRDFAQEINRCNKPGLPGRLHEPAGALLEFLSKQAARPQGLVGQGSPGGLGGPPRAWGSAHHEPGTLPHKLRFLLDPTPHAFWGCQGERKGVFTLSALGNHPTRPPRSADTTISMSHKPLKLKPHKQGGPADAPMEGS